ncbi:unnamed protein product [Cochlearia groenlandica]
MGLTRKLIRNRKICLSHEQDVSLCSVNASSNDIGRVLSDKRLLKMRNYMISQQKIFAGQVFELHRLIMVQKKVAKSPSLVLENKLNGDKDDTMRPLQLQEMSDSKARKTNTKIHKPVAEDYPDRMKPKLPIPSIRKDPVTTIWPQHLLPLLENRWLVPVMYPLGGLVYKPHRGSSPPPHPSASMVPMYGQDSLETAFRFQPRNAKTTVDQTDPRGQFPRWSNTSHVIPLPLKKSQESNYSEGHKSTASSPPKKHKLGVVLPPFPTEPTHHTDEYKHKQEPLVRAIKAIPRKPTFASESAARIFHMILEERRDSDQMIS